jgi:hypothetical protein
MMHAASAISAGQFRLESFYCEALDNLTVEGLMAEGNRAAGFCGPFCLIFKALVPPSVLMHKSYYLFQP